MDHLKEFAELREQSRARTKRRQRIEAIFAYVAAPLVILGCIYVILSAVIGGKQ